jgi:hypothetical protein
MKLMIAQIVRSFALAVVPAYIIGQAGGSPCRSAGSAHWGESKNPRLGQPYGAIALPVVERQTW